MGCTSSTWQEKCKPNKQVVIRCCPKRGQNSAADCFVRILQRLPHVPSTYAQSPLRDSSLHSTASYLAPFRTRTLKGIIIKIANSHKQVVQTERSEKPSRTLENDSANSFLRLSYVDLSENPFIGCRYLSGTPSIETGIFK